MVLWITDRCRVQLLSEAIVNNRMTSLRNENDGHKLATDWSMRPSRGSNGTDSISHTRDHTKTNGPHLPKMGFASRS
jgi:hypothetical protein